MRHSQISRLTLLLSLVLTPLTLMTLPISTHAYTPCAGIQPNDVVLADYTGTIQSTGEKFDGKQNQQFNIAEGRLIQGFYEGMLGLKVGERKTIIVPPQKGYTNPDNAPKSPSGDTLYGKTLVFDVFIKQIVSAVSECNANSGGSGIGSTLVTIFSWIAGIAVVGFIGVTGYFALQKQTTKPCVHCASEGRDRLSAGKCGKCGNHYCRASFSRGCPNCGSNTFVPNDR